MKRADCICSEINLHLSSPPARTKAGQKVPVKPLAGYDQRHDCDYIRARNALIPLAEESANRIVPKGQNGKTAEWSRVFLSEMDRMWRERARN